MLLGNGTGTFDPPINYLTDLGPFYILSSDFNDDDKIDLAVANSGADNVSILLNNLVVDSSQSFVECEGFSVSVGDNKKF